MSRDGARDADWYSHTWPHPKRRECEASDDPAGRNDLKPGRVLVVPGSIEARGHIVDLWSDDERVTHGHCDCGGFDGVGNDALGVLDAWREHYEAAS